MAKTKTHFVCQSCGYQAPKWLGRCPGCQGWNTYVEERVIEEKTRERDLLGFESEAIPTPLPDIVGEERGRFQIGIGEFDRVLGGGIVFGSIILVGGDPGIGKSTLLLQMMNQLALKGKKVLLLPGKDHAGIQTEAVFEKELTVSQAFFGTSDFASLTSKSSHSMSFNFLISSSFFIFLF
jgi:DNA repair protein RadA/Sms